MQLPNPVYPGTDRQHLRDWQDITSFGAKPDIPAHSHKDLPKAHRSTNIGECQAISHIAWHITIFLCIPYEVLKNWSFHKKSDIHRQHSIKVGQANTRTRRNKYRLARQLSCGLRLHTQYHYLGDTQIRTFQDNQYISSQAPPHHHNPPHTLYLNIILNGGRYYWWDSKYIHSHCKN